MVYWIRLVLLECATGRLTPFFMSCDNEDDNNDDYDDANNDNDSCGSKKGTST